MPTNSTVAVSFTPPLGTSPTTLTISNAEVNVPQSVGTLDIPIGTSAATVIQVPFGTVGVADVVLIRNRGNQDLGVRVNGLPASPSVLYQIPANGILMIGHPTPSGGSPLTAVQLETTVIQASAIGLVDFFVFGGS
jgi:hypothetical protein